MDWKPSGVIRWLFDPHKGPSDHLIARWIFLRGLGLIYCSAFLPLLFHIRGLIGPHGILPAAEYLGSANAAGYARFWYAPTLLWISASSHALSVLCWIALAAALLVVVNVWPRAMLLVCFFCFLSFVSAASEFSGYQSDSMLLEAGFLSLFFAPPGFRPGLGRLEPPMRASLFLLQWEWFRIYFESGIAKISSGDPQWRHFTAMDEYYQNGPLPTWIGWYAQHLPHWFHAATAFLTLAIELVLVWMLFLPRRWRRVCFFIVTPLQLGIILTANYTFLNYLVLLLGFLLLNDDFILRFLPQRGRQNPAAPEHEPVAPQSWLERLGKRWAALRLGLRAVTLLWLFYVSTTEMIWMLWPGAPFPDKPVRALQPYRIADSYGLFAVMTRGRYEIEFQGSANGQTWLTYPFRFKPQDPQGRPGIYAPYQPRFDWNLWFASLGNWRADPIVLRTEQRLLSGESDVLALFASNPFADEPPRQVRAVLWQYWFSTPEEKRTQGIWWRRTLLGLYAPTLEREPDGRIAVVEWPGNFLPGSNQ
jgi:hypothetical protein